MDKNSFIIKEIPVKLSDMTTVVDNTAKPIKMSINSNAEVRRNDYMAISYYTIVWNLKVELIPDYTFKDRMTELIKKMPENYGKVNPHTDTNAPLGTDYRYKNSEGTIHYFSTEEEWQNIPGGRILFTLEDFE